jgi:hypothetical protein
MRSPHYFIIKPYNGVRYTNTKKIGEVNYIVSSSIEDYTVTNRFGIVQSVPSWYDGEIKANDIVIVHHNTFRKYYDMNGNESSNWNYVRDNVFLIDIEQIYMFKSDDDVWNAVSPYCFVAPILNDNSTVIAEKYVEKSSYGIIKYLPSDAESVTVGDEIVFKPGSEYEFTVDDEKLYRMKVGNICLRV